MNMQKPELSAAVKLIQQAIDAARAVPGPISEEAGLNLLAQLEGYRDWEHGKENLLKIYQAAKGLVVNEVKDWPTFVVFVNYDESDSYEEGLFMMPPGSTLENRKKPRTSWDCFNEEGSILMPSLVDLGISGASPEADDRTRMDSFVVKKIFSQVPNVEKYGLPDHANELGAKDWIVNDLGWNFLAGQTQHGARYSGVEVDFNDTGDDSGSRYWMEVAVAPSMAQRLQEVYAQALVQSEKDALAGEPSSPAP